MAVTATIRSASVAYHQPGQAGYRRLLVAVVAAAVPVFAAFYSAQPLIGVLARHFSISSAQSSWAVSVTALFLGIGMVAAAPLSDRWGKAPLVKVSVTTTAVLATASALAPSWPAFLAARALLGLAAAGTPAVALAHLHEEIHPGFHARASGTYVGGAGLGAMSGRVLASGVDSLFGWRWGLGAIAVVSAFCAIIVVVCLPEPVSVAYRTGTELPPYSWSSSAHAYWQTLRDRQLLALCLIAAVLIGAVMAVYDVLALRLSAAPYGLPLFVASLAFCDFPIGSAGSAAGGRLAERLGRPRVVLLGALVAIGGLMATLSRSLPVLVLGTAIFIGGFFAAHGVASGWAAARGQERHDAASQASTLYMLSYYMGASLFGAMGAALWTVGGWPDVVALATALLLTAAAIVSALLIRAQRAGFFSLFAKQLAWHLSDDGLTVPGSLYYDEELPRVVDGPAEGRGVGRRGSPVLRARGARRPGQSRPARSSLAQPALQVGERARRLSLHAPDPSRHCPGAVPYAEPVTTTNAGPVERSRATCLVADLWAGPPFSNEHRPVGRT
ncbi:MAG: MFS transporter [Acidimicrobiales bacterium]